MNTQYNSWCVKLHLINKHRHFNKWINDPVLNNSNSPKPLHLLPSFTIYQITSSHIKVTRSCPPIKIQYIYAFRLLEQDIASFYILSTSLPLNDSVWSWFCSLTYNCNNAKPLAVALSTSLHALSSPFQWCHRDSNIAVFQPLFATMFSCCVYDIIRYTLGPMSCCFTGICGLSLLF